MKRKIISLLLISLCTVSLIGCSSKKHDVPLTESTEPTLTQEEMSDHAIQQDTGYLLIDHIKNMEKKQVDDIEINGYGKLSELTNEKILEVVNDGNKYQIYDPNDEGRTLESTISENPYIYANDNLINPTVKIKEGEEPKEQYPDIVITSNDENVTFKDAILNGDWGLSAYNRAITGINDMETDISYAGINDDSLYQVFDEWCNTIGTPKRAIIYKDTKNTDKDDTRYEFIELQFEIGDYILPMAVSISSTNDGYTQTSSVIGSLTQGICKKDHYKSPMSYFDNSQYETETIEF